MLLEWIKERLGIFHGQPAAHQEQLAHFLFPQEPRSRTVMNHLAAYSEMPWVRAFLGKISLAVASATWRVYRQTTQNPRGGRMSVRNVMLQKGMGDSRTREVARRKLMEKGELEEIPDHPLLQLLACDNPLITSHEILQLIQIYLDAVGQCFLKKERSALGVPICFWPIPPHWVIKTPERPGEPFEVRRGLYQEYIPDEDMLWMKVPRPEDPYKREGAGFGTAISDELETDEYSAKFLKAFFLNRARPDIVVMPKDMPMAAGGLPLHQKNMQRLEMGWLQRFRGWQNAMRPLFLSRPVEIKTFDHNFQNLQLKEIRAYERDTIRQVLGIPPELMGMLENSNRSTIESADFFFSQHVIMPRLETLRQHFQQKLAPEFDKTIILDFDSPVQEDKQFLLEAAKSIPWVLTVNESRELLRLPPLQGEDGQMHMVPVNMFPMKTFSEIGMMRDDQTEPSLSEDTTTGELRALKRAAEIVKRRSVS